MVRSHGKDQRVYLGERDASGDLVSIEVGATAETHDTTTMGDDWLEFTPGLLGWEASFEAFYDPASGGIGQQLETPGATIAATSIVDSDADAIGDAAIVLGPSILTNRTTPFTVADMTKLSGTLQGNGRVGLRGVLMHVLGQETVTASTASVDNTASSANGGIGNLHVTAVTGTWDIVVEESSSDGGGDPWATKLTWTQVTAATAQSVQVTGTVERYTRITCTETAPGSITFVAAFARY